MTIPFLNLAGLHSTVRSDLEAAFTEVIATNGFVGGSNIARFEQDFAAAHGRRAAAGCGSGTDALSLALRALGVGPGDEVVVPAMTFVATAEAVVHVGATPVLADVDPETLLLTAESVREVSGPDTRAIIPVHLYGHVVPFAVMQAWRDQGLVVVEDAAQAHLATWEGKLIGEVSHATCFSFYPGKNLGALGDAGLVMSDDVEVIDRVRRLRDHGRATKYEHDQIGWCSRLDGLQAAFLRAKLPHLARWTDARRRVAAVYDELLRGVEGVRLVPWEDGAVHHLLVMRVNGTFREALQKELADAGIGSGVHYPVALSHQPSLAPWARPCPEAEAAAGEVLSLPMDPLMTDDQVAEVCDVVKKASTWLAS